MATQKDIEQALLREFLAKTAEEQDLLKAASKFFFNKYYEPLQKQLPQPPKLVKKEEPNLIQRPGGSWNNGRIRQQKFEGDWKAMKNGIASVKNDSSEGWEN